MGRKLKTVVVDDDPLSVAILQDYCADSPVAEIVATFNNPREFLESRHILKFDLCILDIVMPEMEGTRVAEILKDKPVIFVTGVFEKLRDALEFAPVDIVTKPIYKARLDKALGKAYMLDAHKEEYIEFNQAAPAGKVKLCLPDMMLVVTDPDYSEHKKVFMRDGSEHVLMDYTMESLLDACPLLVQISRGIAVSLEAVHEVEYDNITLKGIPNPNAPGSIQMGRPFKKNLVEKFAYF